MDEHVLSLGQGSACNDSCMDECRESGGKSSDYRGRGVIMTDIIFCGWSGRMGKMVASVLEEDADARLVGGIDVVRGEADFPTFTWEDKIDVKADVLIDFSSPKALDDIIKLTTETGMPAVLCGTGYSDEQIKKIEGLSTKVAVLRSGNMSLGINTLMKLVRDAARILAGSGYDIEITEAHHRNKLDAPSGTALMLAKAACEGAGKDYKYNYGRSERREIRPTDEIGISSVRGGSIVGEHDVIFAGLDEVIEIKHTAYSRAVFAKGAVQAAKFLKGKKAGMYSMTDVIG